MARLTLEQKKYIVDRVSCGAAVADIATELGITWHQVKYWVDGSARVAELVVAPDLKSVALGRTGSSPVSRTQYAYLLGMYLGNGYINKQGKYTWKLRVTLPTQYPGIIEEVATAMRGIGLSPTVAPLRSRAVDVYAYAQDIPEIFPQHGIGPKHARPISLEDWQREIVDGDRIAFIRGLHHSDGSRYVVSSTGRVQYNFTNTSADIVRMYCEALASEGVGYYTYTRPPTGRDHERTTVTITRKESVDWCEHVLGQKI